MKAKKKRKKRPAEGLTTPVDDRQPSGVGLGLRTVTLDRVQEEDEQWKWGFRTALGKLKP